MDDIDRELVALLRANARMPLVEIARQLKVARGTALNRIAKLERNGTIVGYTAVSYTHLTLPTICSV